MRLEPLRNFPVVKDLTVEMTAFFDKWRDAKGYFEPGEAKADFAVVPPQTPARRKPPTPASNASAAASATRPARW